MRRLALAAVAAVALSFTACAAAAQPAPAPFTWAGLRWCPTFKGQDGCSGSQSQAKNFTNLFAPSQVRLSSDGSVHLRMNASLSLSGAFNTASPGAPLESFTPPYALSATVALPCTAGRIDNWPAVWATGLGAWPATGEFDIMEGLGGVPTWTYHYVDAAGHDAMVSRPYTVPRPCGRAGNGTVRSYAVQVAGGVASFYAAGQLAGQVAQSCSAPCLSIGVPVAAGPVVMRFDYATGRYGGPAVGATTMKVLGFHAG